MSKKNKPPRPEPESLGLPRGGVDSHAHLDLAQFDADRDALLDRALACGLTHVGNVFLGPEAYLERHALFAHRPEVFFVLGIHPCDALTCTPEALAAMRQAFALDAGTEARLKAVGEIGLDFYWDDAPHDVQEAAFLAQLALARDLDLPPVIHCRDAGGSNAATQRALELLDQAGAAGRPLLWHCFGGDAALAAAILERGWHVSIPGPVSYAANHALRQAVAAIPLERLLLETDCPYLTAEPWRGKRNHPALATFTAQAVAQAKGLDTAEVFLATGQSARTFFHLETPA